MRNRILYLITLLLLCSALMIGCRNENEPITGDEPSNETGDTIPQSTEPAELKGLTQEYFEAEYPTVNSVYFAFEQPDAPQEDDLRIDTMVHLGEYPFDEMIGVACQVNRSSYSVRGGRPDWQPWQPMILVFGRSAHTGIYERVYGAADFDTVGMSVENIIVCTVYHLTNIEAALWRDGFPAPAGIGSELGFLYPNESAETEILEGWEPIYAGGDDWRQIRVSGLAALCYHSAANDRVSIYRLDTTKKDVCTHRGIRVGSTREEVLAAYPELNDTPYSYGADSFPTSDYLWYGDAETGFGPALLFFFEGDSVSAIRLDNCFD